MQTRSVLEQFVARMEELPDAVPVMMLIADDHLEVWSPIQAAEVREVLLRVIDRLDRAPQIN